MAGRTRGAQPTQPDPEPPAEPAVPLPTAPTAPASFRFTPSSPSPADSPDPHHCPHRAAQTATLMSPQDTPLLPALCPCPHYGPPLRPSMASDLSAKIQVLIRSKRASRVTPEAQPFPCSEHHGGITDSRRGRWNRRESCLTGLALPLAASVFPQS